MNWWRAHHGISNDIKIGIVAAKLGATKAEVGWVWIVLLDYASQNEEDRGNITGLEHEEVSAMSGLSVDRVQVIIDALRDRKMIQPDGRLTTWDKRQPKREREDNSTPRVQALRHMKRHVTPCNATEHHETPCNAQIREEEIRAEESREVPPLSPPAKVAQMPPRGPKASWESVNEAWKWYRDEYPTEVNAYIETQLFISVVETDEDIADLRKNLPAYKLTQRWLEGFGPSSENFLSKRIFKVPPKARDAPGSAPRTKQQANADLWSQA